MSSTPNRPKPLGPPAKRGGARRDRDPRPARQARSLGVDRDDRSQARCVRPRRRPFSVLLIEPMQPANAGEHGDAAAAAAAARRTDRARARRRTERAGLGSGLGGAHARGARAVVGAERRVRTRRCGRARCAARPRRRGDNRRARGAGAPSVGTAVCPADGREPATLAAHADVGLFAARAASRAAGRRSRPAPRTSARTRRR